MWSAPTWPWTGKWWSAGTPFALAPGFIVASCKSSLLAMTVTHHVISRVHPLRIPDPLPHCHVICPAHHRRRISSSICDPLRLDPNSPSMGREAVCRVERHTRSRSEHQELHRRRVCREQGDCVARRRRSGGSPFLSHPRPELIPSPSLRKLCSLASPRPPPPSLNAPSMLLPKPTRPGVDKASCPVSVLL